MSISDAIILGFVQGLTEFLPISSSGHLVVARELFHISAAGGLAFDAILQLATAAAIVLYFWRDLMSLLRGCIAQNKEALREVLFLGVATVPAVFLGLFLESYMESAFRSVALVASTLVAGAGVMAFAEWYARTMVHKPLTSTRALGVGFFQSLALVPGMSRSGMTIVGGMVMGLSREAATRFAFLLGIPVLLGSGLKKSIDIFTGAEVIGNMGALVIGSIVAFVVGLAVIHYLLKFLRTHTLWLFVYYRLALAAYLVLFLI